MLQDQLRPYPPHRGRVTTDPEEVGSQPTPLPMCRPFLPTQPSKFLCFLFSTGHAGVSSTQLVSYRICWAKPTSKYLGLRRYDWFPYKKKTIQSLPATWKPMTWCQIFMGSFAKNIFVGYQLATKSQPTTLWIINSMVIQAVTGGGGIPKLEIARLTPDMVDLFSWSLFGS